MEKLPIGGNLKNLLFGIPNNRLIYKRLSTVFLISFILGILILCHWNSALAGEGNQKKCKELINSSKKVQKDYEKVQAKIEAGQGSRMELGMKLNDIAQRQGYIYEQSQRLKCGEALGKIETFMIQVTYLEEGDEAQNFSECIPYPDSPAMIMKKLDDQMKENSDPNKNEEESEEVSLGGIAGSLFGGKKKKDEPPKAYTIKDEKRDKKNKISSLTLELPAQTDLPNGGATHIYRNKKDCLVKYKSLESERNNKIKQKTNAEKEEFKKGYGDYE